MSANPSQPTPELLQSSPGWDKLWAQHFNEYQGDLRHAMYIHSLRRWNERRILEIGAGSFRDTAALNRWGLPCFGVDFSPESVRQAREAHPAWADRILQGDAKRLEFPGKAFDLSFHNGLWGYFDDTQIGQLVREQARITKRRMIATVHNAHNAAFRRHFEQMAAEDPLYGIRFFYKEEMLRLMGSVCRKVRLFPVGGGKAEWFLYAQLGRFMSLPWKLLIRVRRPETAERLLCIGIPR